MSNYFDENSVPTSMMGQNNDMGGMYPYINANGYPMSYAPMVMPNNTNALSEDEIKQITQAKPNKLDISIPQADNLKAMCTHHNSQGKDVVQRVNGTANQVYCPICGATWYSEPVDDEELHNSIMTVISAMQNAKWLGDLPTTLVRDFMPIIPVLYKFIDINKFAMNQFNRYNNQGGYQIGDDASPMAQWNALMGYGSTIPYNGMMGNNMMYNNPQYNNMNMGMNQNTMMPNNNMYNPAAMNPAGMVNPMQSTMGVNPAAVNPQFTNQANMMMGGTVYNNGMPGNVVQPTMTATATQSAAPTTQPTYKPVDTTTEKVDL